MKLDKFQKATRKANLREVLATGGIIANDGFNMTAVFMPTINGNGHFSLSYAGREKFSRKYGEMVALDRLQYGKCLPMDEGMFYDFCDTFGLKIRENDPPVKTFVPTSGSLEPKAAWPFPVDYRRV